MGHRGQLLHLRGDETRFVIMEIVIAGNGNGRRCQKVVTPWGLLLGK